LIALCAGAAAARSSIIRPYRLGGASAAPTHCVGEIVWINLAAYDVRLPFTGWVISGWGEPQRGEVVMCVLPGSNGRGIKRVLAVAGDTVEIRGDRLVVNGEVARYEPLDPGLFTYLLATNNLGDRFLVERLRGDSRVISCNGVGSSVSELGPVTVPDGHYFLAGDNRANSWDSRYPEFGPVPRSRILGRVIGSGHPVPEPLGYSARR
jgi:signal peptidase I